MLQIEKAALVVIDVQEKLAAVMHEKEQLLKNIATLIKAARILDIPLLWCQQFPHGLGATVPDVWQLLGEFRPIDKMSFSCCGDENFSQCLSALGSEQLLLCGIEAHVCVFQTAVDLMAKSCEVHIIADAVSSRTRENKRLGIMRSRQAGAVISSVEMALFELLRTAEHPKFKQIAKLIK